MIKIAAHTRRKALALLFVTLVVRASIPVGYMPGSLQSGSLFEMCPDGLPAAMVRAFAGHHHHGGAHDEATSDGSEQCDFGHLITPAASAFSATIALEAPNPSFLPERPERVAIARSTFVFSPRAPPALTWQEIV